MEYRVEATSLDEAITKLQMIKKFQDFKLNKLQQDLYGQNLLSNLPDSTLADIVQNNRGCGKTTAVALQLISDAIWHPNKPVKLRDTSNPQSRDSVLLAHQFRDVVEDIIVKLGLKFMVINKVSNTLTLEI